MCYFPFNLLIVKTQVAVIKCITTVCRIARFPKTNFTAFLPSSVNLYIGVSAAISRMAGIIFMEKRQNHGNANLIILIIPP